MHPLYTLGINAYCGALKLASLRNPKARRLMEGQREVFKRLEAAFADAGGKWVWIHAASLGEFEQGRPLIERIRRERPGLKILLTFFSPSGYEVRRDYKGADCVSYLPLDRPSNVTRFLDIVRPSMAIFVKYEFWGNYLTELKRRGIPTYIISSIFRPGQIFFRPYGGEFRQMLRCFSHIYVQDDASRRRLAGIGIENVTAAGDTRFDRVSDIRRSLVDMPVLDKFVAGAKNVLIAGSTWPADEELLFPAIGRLDDMKAIVAPHEFDDARLAEMRSQLGAFGPVAFLSELEADSKLDASKYRFVIVDSFGRLSSIYRKGTIAYIGGGFGTGIHNINEAAAYAVPVIFGPRHHKFKEAADLIACGGGFSVDSAESLGSVLARFDSDAAARTAAGNAAGAYIARSIGATDIIFNDLFSSPTPSK